MNQIIKVFGIDTFIKGRNYPSNYVKHINTKLLDNHYVHEFKVKSQSSYGWYHVILENNGNKILNYSCECKQYEKKKNCKHIVAALIKNYEKIMESIYVNPEDITNTILEQYLSNNHVHQIKNKLNLEVEFEIKHSIISIHLYVGEDKLYSLSESKLNHFLNSYYNETKFEFGKLFMYDPSKHYFDSKDIKLLEFVADYNQNNYIRPFLLSNREFEYCLELLQNKNFKIKNIGEILDVKYGLPTNFILKLKEEKYILSIEDYDLYQFLDSKRKYVVYKNVLYLLNDEETKYLKKLKDYKIETLVFSKDQIYKFNNGLFKKLKNNIILENNIKEISLPTKPEIKLYFDITSDMLICKPVFEYNGIDIPYNEPANILKDEEVEENLIYELLNYGMVENENLFIIDEEDLMYEFIEKILPDLSNKYHVFTSKNIDKTKIMRHVSTSSNFSIGKDGIMTYTFKADGINQGELNSIFHALKLKKKYYRLKNNQVVDLQENEEIEELKNLLEDLDISNNEISKGNVQIPKYRALYIDSLKSNHKNIKTNNLFDEFIQNFKKYQNINIKFDKFEEKILRDYQKDGVKWLTTIYKCDLGGILADEMGLGKSIQTISLIKQILKEKKDAKILIVAPTSLIYNWEKEFEKYGSDLKYVVVAENKNKRKQIFNQKENYNIFITTYGLIRNDNDEYEQIDFELCVIDEAQMIKNYKAGMTKEIKKIKSKCNIALTGTPVENNITELWSIFDFIMPGYLNNIFNFTHKYNLKDMDEEGLSILKKLHNQIAPFILRRKKKDVAKSLPEKMENKIYLDLPKKQKMLYMKTLQTAKDEIDDLINHNGFEKSRMKILQLLMVLRQTCIDPTVIYENYDGERIKIEELLNILKNLKEAGHKVLIFSSFKRVLENVEKELINENISYYMIDGSVKSKRRMEMVESFNHDDTDCFLITLKSGGTGLNLVGADTVIHLDIWWNPQVENQATDRAHRIGQTKNVTVIKMITKGTIEERIIELQEKKKMLSDNLIEGNQNHEVLSSLTESDIKNLLSN